jgi:microcystin degradation protein MlrC
MVHPYTTAADLGWAVHVCTDGDQALADRLVEELADRAWAEREVPLPPMRSVDEALDEVARGNARRFGPVTLVDVDDIVGAGAPGGNTQFVQALAKNDRGLRAFVPVHDPALVDELWNAAIDSTHDVVLRGTPGYGQPEVPLRARVAARVTTQFGRTIRLEVGASSWRSRIGRRYRSTRASGPSSGCARATPTSSCRRTSSTTGCSISRPRSSTSRW